MKDAFNLEQVLGKLAQSIANGNYRDDFAGPLGKLMDLAGKGNKDAAQAFAETVDFLSEKTGKQQTLFLTDELLGQKHEDSAGLCRLQEWLMRKWESAAANLSATDRAAALNYAHIAASKKKEAHPLAERAAQLWSNLVDRDPARDDVELKYHYNLKGIENPFYRREILLKLEALAAAKPDMVLEQMTALWQDNYYSFYDKDKESAAIIARTIASILENNILRFDKAKSADFAWKLLAQTGGADPAAELAGARIYMTLASLEPDAGKAFDMYSGVAERRQPNLAAYAAQAKDAILQLADAGAFDDTSRFEVVADVISDKIFHPAVKSAAKADEALAARAATTILSMTRKALQKRGSNYRFYNAITMLLGYYPPDDPRAPEVTELWKSALVRDHKQRSGDEYYLHSVGAMLNIAAVRGDDVNAAYARSEWHETLAALTEKNPERAYKLLHDILQRSTSPSPVVEDIRAQLPALQARAGVVYLPEEMSAADFSKILKQARQRGPRG